MRHEKKNTFLSAPGPRLNGAGRRLHCPLAFSGRPTPPTPWTFRKPAAAVRRAPDGHRTSFGRDILTRHGRRGRDAAHCLGLPSPSTVVALLVGALTGWYGGWVDELLNARALNDALASFPTYLILLVLVSLLGGGREHNERLRSASSLSTSYRVIVRTKFAPRRLHAELRPSAELMGASHRANPLCSHSVCRNICTNRSSPAITIAVNQRCARRGGDELPLHRRFRPTRRARLYASNHRVCSIPRRVRGSARARSICAVLILGVSLIGAGPATRGEN